MKASLPLMLAISSIFAISSSAQTASDWRDLAQPLDRRLEPDRSSDGAGSAPQGACRMDTESPVSPNRRRHRTRRSGNRSDGITQCGFLATTQSANDTSCIYLMDLERAILKRSDMGSALEINFSSFSNTLMGRFTQPSDGILRASSGNGYWNRKAMTGNGSRSLISTSLAPEAPSSLGKQSRIKASN